MVKTYHFYGSVTATANAVSTIEIRRKGTIIGIDWTITTSSTVAVGDSLEMEICTASTAMSRTNDAMGVCSTCGISVGITTSGGTNSQVNKFVGPTAIPVAQGDRLYLHCAFENGSSTWISKATVHINE